ncbi:MAG: rhodanese-like domain-containing protein [Proteobacteria bacterium]|nr:rhodanese-like domain-containing protein [Pseudomonadota bacterium]
MTAKTAAQMVAEARAAIENLTPDQVEAELAHGALLIDVREDGECAQCAIPGALHIVRGMLEFRADPASPMHQPGLDPNRRVILHCASGGRSALCAVTLRQLGYTRVAHLDGGMQAWLAAGKPTTKS